MIAIKRERPEFISIVLPSQGQDWQRDLLELIDRRHHRIVVSVRRRMFKNALKICRWISHKRIQRLEGNTFLVGLQKFRTPKFLVGEEILLLDATVRGREPLNIVTIADIIIRGVVERWVGRRDRCDGGQMRRKFFGRGPLIEAGIGAAPPGNLAVAERLFCEPLYNVASIARVLRKRPEFT